VQAMGSRTSGAGARYVPGREGPLRSRLERYQIARIDDEDSRDGDAGEPACKPITTSRRDTEREPSPRVAFST